MKEIAAQYIDGVWVPHSPEDAEISNTFKPNQIARMQITGFQKQRSVSQLGLLHACMKVVAEMSRDENWNNVARVKLSLKVALNYIDESSCVVANDRVVLAYRSFGFKYLAHMEACSLFDRAFPLLADVLGVTEEELILEAKSRMVRRRRHV